MDISRLDNDFIDNMRDMLGESELDKFLDSLKSENRIKALRVNNLKISDKEFLNIFPYELDKILFTNNGYKLINDSISYGNTIYHHLGLFYMQEPSAMLPITILSDYIGSKVLDLCSAPGGKATQIAPLLCENSILVLNEIVFNRAKILKSNVERMGIRNAIITSNSPKDLEKAYPHYFDTIIVDAPCSGEGMLRKEPQVLNNWSLANVNACATRDLEILNSADKMLEIGGHIVYSTCTLNKFENEYVIEKFIQNGRYEIVKLNSDIYNYVSHGYGSVRDAVRVFPHSSIGEGHFAVVLKKVKDDYDDIDYLDYSPYTTIKPYKKELDGIWSDIASIDYFGEPLVYKDNIYLINPLLPFYKGINIVTAGVNIASIERGRVIPHHNLVTALRKGEYNNYVDYDFDSVEIKKYMAGEVILTDKKFKGFGTITANGYGLGLVKNVEGTLKNHYPKAFRVK